MIEGSTLTYANQPSAFVTWRPADNNLNTLLVSVITTIIVSQLFSIVHSVVLGCKMRNIIARCDLYTQLVAWRSSPSAVSQAISGVQDGQYPSPTIPQAMKLIALVVAAPLINAVFVALSIEREQEFTFRTAGFGGIALGLRLNNSVLKTKPLSSGCEQVPLDVAHGSDQKAEAKFVLCETRTQLRADASEVLFVLEVFDLARIAGFHVIIRTWAGAIHGTKKGEVVSSSKTLNRANLFALHYLSSEEYLREWAFSGLRVAQERCGDEFKAFETFEKPGLFSTFKVDNYLTFRAVCARQNVHEMQKLMGDTINKMLAKVSFVNAERSFVSVPDEPIDLLGGIVGLAIRNETRTLDDVVLFRRRAPIASVGVLLVILLVVVLFRIVLSALVANDVAVAIGSVVRHELGLPCADSMLSAEEVCVEH
ncbi:hypothetical protein BWQ96_05231 [Gracilariopsis chorda]|uniref:Uncharacterized protein n=1 Tax=Gracilariopsis chorda TaxID=448386 RepID=A0A2V3ISA6_9FLOR|nr:hypothetical protein BWQ96_05231 [Gracilariopsis chorda]|eukprot:PXF44984.1 hypothetical protein BWQ96_05231 [Gracilariopsis chorda]